MFGQLAFVRLKAAEKAIKEGRLDEAFRLAIAPDLRDHKRAEKVLAKTGKKLIERARQHFRADRFDEALADLDKAAVAGERLEEITELRDQIRIVAREVSRNEESRHRRMHAARKRIEEGSFRAGKRILEQASRHDAGAKKLKRDIDLREEHAADAFKQVRDLLKNKELPAAIERFRRAKELHPHAGEAAELETTLIEQVLQNVRRALCDGRLERAGGELRSLGDFGASRPGRQDMERILSIAQAAGADMQAGRYEEARVKIMRLQRLLPEAKWTKPAEKQFQQIDELVANLHAGPLGAASATAHVGHLKPTLPVRKPVSRSLAETLPLPPTARGSGAGNIALPLLVLVDGAGSYLLVRHERATIGRAASGKPADIPLVSDLHERHADIARMDGDYFLISSHQFEVGGRKLQQKLLADGDRVVFSRQARFTFRQPDRRSTSCVLDLADSVRMPHDVRRVVMFDGHATMGRSRSAHLGASSARRELILFERDGLLYIRPKPDGHEQTEATAVNIGQPIDIEGVSFVLQPWKVNPMGSIHT